VARSEDPTVWQVCAGMACSAAIGVVIALWAKSIADVGDLLGFVGAAVGAGLTIFGAIWVERRKVVAVDRRRADVLRQSLKEFRELLASSLS